jgi:hypothetical protein
MPCLRVKHSWASIRLITDEYIFFSKGSIRSPSAGLDTCESFLGEGELHPSPGRIQFTNLFLSSFLINRKIVKTQTVHSHNSSSMNASPRLLTQSIPDRVGLEPCLLYLLRKYMSIVEMSSFKGQSRCDFNNHSGLDRNNWLFQLKFRISRYPICWITASPNSEHLTNVAPSIKR